MADAAAFFAKKKKKKTPFKFNANKIDVNSVTTTVHVDAPALSTDKDGTSGVTSALAATSLADPAAAEGADATGELWDDEAMAATYARKGATAAVTAPSAEILDMKALDPKRNESDDIAEKLRVEETKAALAKAREGMEREGQRIKEEREQKEQEKKPVAPRFGAAAANAGIGIGGGGKWVPPHQRAGAAGSLSRVRLGGSSMPQKLDVQDQELFPDLASADAILEQQQKHAQPAFKVVKKTPVGGGATWGSKASQKASPTPPQPAAPVEEAKPTPPPEVEQEKAVPAPAPAPAPASAASQPKPVKKKKKKKDLSTFKPSATS